MPILVYGVSTLLAFAVGLLSSGAAFLVQTEFMIKTAAFMVGFVLLLQGIYQAVGTVLNRRSSTVVGVIGIALELQMALVIFQLPQAAFWILAAAMCLYLSFFGVIKLTQGVIEGLGRRWSALGSFLLGCMQLGMIAVLVIWWERHQIIVEVTLGGAMLVLGAMYLEEFIRWKWVCSQPDGKYRTMVSLPDLVALVLPAQLYDHIRQRRILQEELQGKEHEPELEVLFHLSGTGVGTGGHCELCYKGETITYGCYDYRSHFMGGIAGRGVLFRASRDEYLSWSIRGHKKTIVSFGLSLTQAQKEAFEAALERMLQKDGEVWQPPAGIPGRWEINPRDFSNQLYAHVPLRFYRMRKGRFKYYFMPSINCVTITNRLLKEAKITNLLMYGIHTPGAYLEYLHKHYRTGSGIISSCRVYDGENLPGETEKNF